MSQTSIPVPADDPRDGVTANIAPTDKPATDPAWFFESTRDTHKFIREVSGRQFNAQNTTYFLPADKAEYERLGKQHVCHCTVLGDELYPRPEMVEFILRPELGIEKKVLDIGCGSGIWTLSMATKFPHVKVIGIDLAPAIMDEGDVHSNCRFELDDVNRGLPRFHGQVDLVHIRSVCAGIKNYSETVRELVKCLKPGGMLMLVEGGVEWHTEDQTHLAVPADPDCPDLTQPGKTWLGRIAYECGKAQSARGGDVMQAMQLVDHGLWDHPAIDPDSCGVIAGFVPIGSWPQSVNPEEHQRLSMLGTLVSQNMKEICSALKIMFLEKGIPKHAVDRWHDNGDQELLQYYGTVCLWSDYRYAWGRKLLADGTAAPHIPVQGLPYRPIPPHFGGQAPPCDPLEPYGKYPLSHYYPTAERARQWMEWKAMERERLGHEPRPNPVSW